MGDEQPRRPTDQDAELERQIRAERKFSLAEAIGRMAGPGSMKGASPVDRKQQATAEIEEYVHRHLPDTGGVLAGVLSRQVRESELLLKGYEKPLTVLVNYVRLVLGSEYALRELVRQADVEWGRVFGERPRLDIEGRAPAADDPYTLESVRAAMTCLANGLPS